MSIPSVTFQPASDYPAALTQAAKLWSIDRFYWDIFGKKHTASDEVIRAILSSVGVDVSSLQSLNEAVRQRLLDEWSQMLPEVEVVGKHVTAPAWVNLPENIGHHPLKVTFDWEDGGRSEYVHITDGLQLLGKARINGTTYYRRRLPLPTETPYGYHSLTIQLGGNGTPVSTASTELVVTPDRAYEPAGLLAGERRAGIGASLYGLRSRRNWGCGDFTDLKEFSHWAASELHCSFVALNPLHSIANRLPFNASPYLPLSTYFKNFIYTDVERLPEFDASPLVRKLVDGPGWGKSLEALRARDLVDYENVARLKLGVLALCFLEFRKELKADSPRASAFQAWCEQQGELLDGFTTFCALDRHIHKRNADVWVWQDWPEPYQHPASDAVRAFAARHRHLKQFYAWVQWITFQQLEEAGQAASDLGMSIGLYHDLALATDNCGADVWANRDYFVMGCRVGAPPDDFSPEGQDWSFPPPDYLRHKRSAYHLFRESIRRNMLAGGALRIDHVMRFFRLYWIPAGFKASEGTYVRDFAENLVRILALESVRNQVMIIGEDLGTVEPETRETLARFGIYSYRLFYFERDESGAMKLPDAYPQDALVATSTHDLPTIAGSWIGRDIEARDYSGLLPDHEVYLKQWEDRRELKQRILDALFTEGLMPSYYTRRANDIPEFTGELHNAIIGYLASTPSKLLQINQEDLTKQLDQQNLPGSTWQYPNWQRKMNCRIEDLRKDPLVSGCAAMLRHWLDKSSRNDTD